MQNISLRVWLFGAVQDSWDWHGREELEAGEESEKRKPRKNGIQQKIQVFIGSQYQMMHGVLHRNSLSAAGKLWDDNNFAFMKIADYCKALEAQGGTIDKPMQLTRLEWLWCVV
jgi:hypothetical protein